MTVGKLTSMPITDAQNWRIPGVFSWLQREGHVSEEEMARTFNCGVGAVLVVSEDQQKEVLRELEKQQEESWVIGMVVTSPEGNCFLCGALKFRGLFMPTSVPIIVALLPVDQSKVTSCSPYHSNSSDSRLRHLQSQTYSYVIPSTSPPRQWGM